jgi:hypothetical protein
MFVGTGKPNTERNGDEDVRSTKPTHYVSCILGKNGKRSTKYTIFHELN